MFHLRKEIEGRELDEEIRKIMSRPNQRRSSKQITSNHSEQLLYAPSQLLLHPCLTSREMISPLTKKEGKKAKMFTALLEQMKKGMDLEAEILSSNPGYALYCHIY